MLLVCVVEFAEVITQNKTTVVLEHFITFRFRLELTFSNLGHALVLHSAVSLFRERLVARF